MIILDSKSRKAMFAKKKNSNYDSSGDVTKYCKGCSKSFKENHSHGSGYCSTCRSRALKDDNTWKIGICSNYSESRKRYCKQTKGHSGSHTYFS